MSTYNLRAHHGLCIQFFKGKGYSDDFIENMTNVIKKLNDNPPITIVTKDDIICKICPNLNEGVCLSENKVNNIDKKVMDICNISKNEVMLAKDYLKLVYDKIISKGMIEQICSDCQWISICSEKR